MCAVDPNSKKVSLITGNEVNPENGIALDFANNQNNIYVANDKSILMFKK